MVWTIKGARKMSGRKITIAETTVVDVDSGEEKVAEASYSGHAQDVIKALTDALEDIKDSQITIILKVE